MLVLAVDLSLMRQKITLEEKLGLLASLKSRWEYIQTHVWWCKLPTKHRFSI